MMKSTSNVQSLRQWAIDNEPEDNNRNIEARWRDMFWRHIVFIRDALITMFDRRFPVTAKVIGSHVSLNVTLPVVEISQPMIGLRVIVWGNFYVWKCTVLSAIDIPLDLSDAIEQSPSERDDCPNPINGERSKEFPEDVLRGYKCDNPKEFSFSVTGEYELYAVLRQIEQFLFFVRKNG